MDTRHILRINYLPALVSLVLAAGLLVLSLALMVGMANADGLPDPVSITDEGAVTGIDLAPSDPSLPLGGLVAQVNGLVVHPDIPGTLFATVGDPNDGGNAQVYRSTDGAISWAPVYTANATKLHALAVTGAQVIAAGEGPYGQDTIVRSADGGTHWTGIFSGTPGFQHVFRVLAVHPVVTTTLYAAGSEWGPPTYQGTGVVYRSLDGGATWTRILAEAAGCCWADLYGLAVHPTTPSIVFAAGYASDATGPYAAIYRTDDGGTNWTTVYTETDPGGRLQQFTSLAIHPVTPATIYAGTGFGPKFVYRATDGGLSQTSWTKVLTDSGFRLALEPPNTVYSADDWREIYRSTAGGQGGTWVKVGDVTPCDIRSLAIDATSSPATLYVGCLAEGIYRSTNGGVDWEECNLTPRVLLPPGFVNEPVVTGLSQPTAIDWAPDGRMFIAHQDGRVKVFENGQLLPNDFIDISTQVNNNWNRGLLGIAVHPSFPITPYVYLLFTYDPAGLPGDPSTVDGPDGWGSRVSRLIRVSADPAASYNVAEPGTEVVLLGHNSTLDNIGDPADPGGENLIPACDDDGTPIVDCLPSEGPSHSIGMVTFGHDGSLFVSNGEGAPYINPDPRAARSQDLDSLGGKILRIDPETGTGYPDNPFYDGDPTHNRSKIWSLGLRNPFRFTLDPVTDTLYVGDVGWYSWEEINTGRGRNFGWPCYEGGDSGNVRHSLYRFYTGTQSICGPLYAQEPDNGVQAPLYAYPNTEGAAVVLGAVYTGTTYPTTYHNALFVADYDSKWIKYLTIDKDDGTAAVHDFARDVSTLGAPVQLALGPDDSLYFVALNPDPHGSSEIRCIRYTEGPTALSSATPTNGYPPLTVSFSSAGSSDPNETPSQLSYEWTFGDTGTSTARNPTHTYTISGTYTAILTVTNSQDVSSADSIVITVGNLAPTATIQMPAAGSTYTMGLSVVFSGTGIDADDGILAAGDLEWDARFYFNGHFHSPFFSATGAGGTLVVPNHNDNTSVVLCLTATDSGGLQDTDCVEIYPRTVVYAFDTAPSGLQLIYDGIYYATPFAKDVIVNAQRSIAAPPVQGGFEFISWSDGGGASHVIAVGSTGQAFLARYGWFIRLPLVFRSHPSR